MTRYLMIGMVACTAFFSAHAQSKLVDLVREASAEWMLGTWEATTDNGETVRITLSWDLQKTAVLQEGQMGDIQFKGYSFVEPGGSEVKYFGLDSRGSVSKGNWDMAGGDLVLRAEQNVVDRGVWKTGIVYSGSASEGLQLRLHQINEYGDLVQPARTVLKFKKK